MSASTLLCRLSAEPFLVEAEAEAAFLLRALTAFAFRLIARAFLAMDRFFVREVRRFFMTRLLLFFPDRTGAFLFFFCFFFAICQK